MNFNSWFKHDSLGDKRGSKNVLVDFKSFRCPQGGGGGGNERASHDALLPTILSKSLDHVIFHFDMDAVRMTSR